MHKGVNVSTITYDCDKTEVVSKTKRQYDKLIFIQKKNIRV